MKIVSNLFVTKNDSGYILIILYNRYTETEPVNTLNKN